jgi:hypothetical protein
MDWQLITKTDRTGEVPDASMIWVSCTLEGKETAWFDDVELVAYDRDKLPSDFDVRFGASNRPPGFAVLARRLGVWDTQTTIKPAVWVPQGKVVEGVDAVEWELGETLLRSRFDEQPGNAKSLILETYDAQAGVYRMWPFDSNGNFPRGEYRGTWDDAAKALTYEGVDSAGVAVESVQRWVSEDRLESHAVWKNKDGNIVMELDKASVRRP